jgi:hypothetical protein
MPKYRRPADQVRDLKRIDQDILNLQVDARGSELYSYSVAWTAEDGTAPSVGNGSLVGKYRRVGTMVLVNIRMTIGSTTAQGTGTWNFSPPFEVDTSSFWTGSAVGYNQSNSATGPWIPGSSLIEATGPGARQIVGVIGPIGTQNGVARLRAGMPVSWDTGSILYFSLWYGTTE